MKLKLAVKLVRSFLDELWQADKILWFITTSWPGAFIALAIIRPGLVSVTFVAAMYAMGGYFVVRLFLDFLSEQGIASSRYSWKKFERDCRALVSVLELPPASSFGRNPTLPGIVEIGRSGISSLYGIPKGGGPAVAQRLSEMLGIPVVQPVNITSSTLIVGDIVRSQRTMTEFLQTVPTNFFATLVVAESKPRCRTLQTSYNSDLGIFFLYGRRVHEDLFLEFPWD